VYSKKSWTQISDIRRGAVDKDKLDRLQNLVRERAGHWLAMQVEAAKIALSDAPEAVMDLGRIAPGETLTLHRPDFDGAISELVGTVSRTVVALLKDAGVDGDDIDTVFFTGGSSGVPLLREQISALLPQARSVEGDRFGSIGAGLALDAVRKFG
jgi:hypothetical chaperone protein